MDQKRRSEPTFVSIASRQHGVVSRRQLLAEGVSAKAVDRWVAAGQLRCQYRGVYLLGNLRGSLEPERAAEMAAVLACGPRAALSHESAGRLWGLVRRPQGRTRSNRHGGSSPRAPVVVTIPHGTKRRRPGIRIHRATDLSLDDVTHLDNIPITTVGRTLRDLAMVLTPRALNRVAARAEKEGLMDAAGFPELVARHRGQRGAPALKAALLGEDGLILTESEAEERFLGLAAEAGLPRPRVNFVIHGYRADFYWERARLVVEVDGFAFHSSRGSFEGDHGRDIDLESKGIRVLRVTWRQIVRERTATASALSAAHAHATARAG